MGRSHIILEGREFIDKILQGERDFSYTCLTEFCLLPQVEGYAAAMGYLKSQSLQRSPLNLECAIWRQVDVSEIWMPWVFAPKIDLTSTNISRSMLYGGFFPASVWHGTRAWDSQCQYARFWSEVEPDEKTIITSSELHRINLDSADMRYIQMDSNNMENAVLTRAFFDYATLKNIAQFNTIQGLDSISLKSTYISRKEFNVLEPILIRRSKQQAQPGDSTRVLVTD